MVHMCTRNELNMILQQMRVRFYRAVYGESIVRIVLRFALIQR